MDNGSFDRLANCYKREFSVVLISDYFPMMSLWFVGYRYMERYEFYTCRLKDDV